MAKRKVSEMTAPTTYTRVVSELPQELQFAEPNANVIYPEYLKHDKQRKFSLRTLYHGPQTYRANDRPRFAKGAKRLVTSSVALLQIRDAPLGERSLFGSVMRQSPTDGSDPRTVKIICRPDSQYPALEVTVKMGHKWVTCSIYSNSLTRSEDDIGLAFTTGIDLHTSSSLPEDGHVKELAAKNSLLRIRLELIPVGSEPMSGTVGRPIWSGISQIELDDLVRRYDTNTQLTAPEKAIVLLYRTNNLAVYIESPKELVNDLAPFFEYMRSIMYASAHLGNFWWYTIGLSAGSTSCGEYSFSMISIPRWLVTRWIVTYENDEPKCAKALTSVPLRPISRGLYPDTNTFVFFQKLILAREAYEAANLTDAALLMGRNTSMALLISTGTNRYVANLKMTGSGADSLKGVYVRPGTKIKLSLLIGDKLLELMGAVDKNTTANANLCIGVSIQPQKAHLIKDISPAFPASVSFPYDRIAANRRLDAISTIQSSQERSLGHEILGIASGIARSNSMQPSWLRSQLPIGSNRLQRFQAELSLFNLQGIQLNAINTAIVENSSGINLVVGPPDSGKTETMLALICALMSSGIKVLVTAPSDAGVEKLTSPMSELVQPDQQEGMNWARFTTHTSTDALEGLTNSWSVKDFEAGLKNLSECGDQSGGPPERDHSASKAFHSSTSEQLEFSTTKLEFIRRQTTKAEFVENETRNLVRNEVRDSAIEYFKLYQELHLPESKSPTEANDNFMRFRELDTFFSNILLEQEVFAVFCTNSSACHPALSIFKPSVLCMYETDTASVADAMTAFAPYQDCLRCCFLVGDDTVSGSIPVFSKCNEGAQAKKVSFLEMLGRDSCRRASLVRFVKEATMDSTGRN